MNKKGWKARQEGANLAGSHCLPAGPHLQPSVEVPVEPLHNEQHGNAGAPTVVVVDDRTMEVHQSLMFRQRPDEKERGLDYNAQQATTWEGITLRPCFVQTHRQWPSVQKEGKENGFSNKNKEAWNLKIDRHLELRKKIKWKDEWEIGMLRKGRERQ